MQDLHLLPGEAVMYFHSNFVGIAPRQGQQNV